MPAGYSLSNVVVPVTSLSTDTLVLYVLIVTSLALTSTLVTSPSPLSAVSCPFTITFVIDASFFTSTTVSVAFVSTSRFVTVESLSNVSSVFSPKTTTLLIDP